MVSRPQVKMDDGQEKRDSRHGNITEFSENRDSVVKGLKKTLWSHSQLKVYMMLQECLTIDSCEVTESGKMLLEFWSTVFKSFSQPFHLSRKKLNWLCLHALHCTIIFTGRVLSISKLWQIWEWRHNPIDQLPSICLQGSNRSSVYARQIRDEFLD